LIPLIILIGQVERIGPQHQAGSDSLLTGRAFFKMQEIYFEDEMDDSKVSWDFQRILYCSVLDPDRVGSGSFAGSWLGSASSAIHGLPIRSRIRIFINFNQMQRFPYTVQNTENYATHEKDKLRKLTLLWIKIKTNYYFPSCV
jgi:hypothetical protein